MPPWSTDPTPPIRWTAVESKTLPHTACPEAYRDRVAILSLHDGAYVPQRLLTALPAHTHRAFADEVITQRDWGASRVARHLAAALGLGGFHEVQVARAVMDFNRFPGVTPPRPPTLIALRSAACRVASSTTPTSAGSWRSCTTAPPPTSTTPSTGASSCCRSTPTMPATPHKPYVQRSACCRDQTATNASPIFPTACSIHSFRQSWPSPPSSPCCGTASPSR